MSTPPAIPDHTLLRVIGRGSYGEVWLARNVMATHRAVKIVRRDSFDSDRPYLREFEGIRRCEPVSRAHDGLIDILHMGRSDEEGWFYYVMELADSTGPSAQTDQSDYRPATLSARLTNGKMLEVTECLRIAESLAGALAFLHEQGLIHRDVKPSNVMYAGGVPKLGDIGLVAEAGSSRSFVGTEGFVPLEGPGTERADIFALGKVLYEALTGMDRSQFPLLPREWRHAYDFNQRVELNEIVLRACEGQRERRYATAREMLADIALVASGRSVKKLRGMEGKLRALRWLGAAAAIITAVAVGFSLLGQSQAARERTLRERAEKAEEESREGRYAAMLGQVQAARHDRSPGAATRALAIAAELARLHPTPALRDEAAFLLGRGEFQAREDLHVPGNGRACASHPDTGMVALTELFTDDSIVITFRIAGASAAPRTVRVADVPPHCQWPVFSGDGRRLLLLCAYGGGVVVDVASGEAITRIATGTTSTSLLNFCGHDGDRLVRQSSSGGLAFYEIPDGERTVIPVDWPASDQSHGQTLPTPSPDGKSVLLVYRGVIPVRRMRDLVPLIVAPPPGVSPFTGSACLVESATGRILWQVDGPDDQAAAWSPEGMRLAVRCAGEIRLLDAATGATTATVPQRIYNGGTRLCFIGSSGLLAWSTWSQSGSYDLQREEHTPGLPCEPANYGPRTRRLFSAADSGVRAAEWRPSPVLRVLRPPTQERMGVYVNISPDERWLICGTGEAFHIFDLTSGEDAPASILPAPFAGEVTFPDAGSIEFLSRDGIHRTSWTGTPPASLPAAGETALPAGTPTDFTASSADGKVRAYSGSRFVRVLSGSAAPREFPTGDTGNPLSLSPDGRWLALGAQHSGTVRVWDLQSDAAEPAKEQPCGTVAVPAFSPDGSWLVCAGHDATLILRTGTWEEVHRLPCGSGGLMGHLHFTGDSRHLMVRSATNICRLVETGTWSTLLHLASPPEELLNRSALSAGGRYFAAVGARNEINVWDLSALRVELNKLGLAEDTAPAKRAVGE